MFSGASALPHLRAYVCSSIREAPQRLGAVAASSLSAAATTTFDIGTRVEMRETGENALAYACPAHAVTQTSGPSSNARVTPQRDLYMGDIARAHERLSLSACLFIMKNKVLSFRYFRSVLADLHTVRQLAPTPLRRSPSLTAAQKRAARAKSSVSE